MTSSAPPASKGLRLTVSILIGATFIATSASVFALLKGDVNLAKAWAVTAGLASTTLQLALVWIGMKAFQIWRKEFARQASEWALIQQELGRRREQGDWS